MRDIPESKPLEHRSDSSSSQQSLLNELGTNHSTSVAKTVIRCQIIGECYIQDAVDGEALKYQQDNLIDDVEFNIH
jgi:hypothetical protein